MTDRPPYHTRRRQLLHAVGLCTQCKQPSQHGYWRCARCREKAKEVLVRRRRKLAASNICPQCGANPPDAPHRHCRPCLDAMSESQQRRHRRLRLLGRCVRCGTPSGGPCRCEACNAKRGGEPA